MLSHLSPLIRSGRLEIWYDKEIAPGAEWGNAIISSIRSADIILLLVSADAMASDYFSEKEVVLALERHNLQATIVVPIIIRACHWEATSLKDFQVLPLNRKPVTEWTSQDAAWNTIVHYIDELIDQFNSEHAEEGATPLIENNESQSAVKTDFEDPFSSQLIYVEGGTFLMGSNEYADESPLHQVNVLGYYLCKYPVTQMQWELVMGAGSNPSAFKGNPELPVERVSWHEAQAFIGKLTELSGDFYRLPSEAEWEYAARGGKSALATRFAGSDELHAAGWFEGNSNNKTHPVGQKKANTLGLFDMNGNVWEWCQDTWHDNYSGAPSNGHTWTTRGDQRRQVLRGGSWKNDEVLCRVSSRLGYPRSKKVDNVGFRVARG
jgi:formylglycine-generating enzyme required for sulfatase activity